MDFDSRTEPYLFEIPPGERIPGHFFAHKGEEIGFLLRGSLVLKLEHAEHTVRMGDLVSLSMDIPQLWENRGEATAELLWIKVK